MRVTSAQAAKLLRQLNDELRALQLKEANSSSFVAAIQEDVESVRPEYNFKEMRDAQAEVECKIRKVKHAINVFNTTTIIPDFNITIDEMLVYLPQLNAECATLSKMRDAMPKVRVSSGYSGGGGDYRNDGHIVIGEDDRASSNLPNCGFRHVVAVGISIRA